MPISAKKTYNITSWGLTTIMTILASHIGNPKLFIYSIYYHFTYHQKHHQNHHQNCWGFPKIPFWSFWQPQSFPCRGSCRERLPKARRPPKWPIFSQLKIQKRKKPRDFSVFFSFFFRFFFILLFFFCLWWFPALLLANFWKIQNT